MYEFWVDFQYDYTYWEEKEGGLYSVQRKGSLGSGRRMKAESEAKAKAFVLSEARRLHKDKPWFKEFIKNPWKHITVRICKERIL